MLKIRTFALAAAAVLVTAAPSAQAATFLQVGTNALCSSGGCFGSGNTFQKVWSAAQQSGPVDISSLFLDRNVLGDRQDFAVKVGFSLADGTKVGDWGAFTIAVLGGQVVQVGGQAFTWDTSRGDLVLTLSLVVPEKGGGGFFGGGLLGGGRGANFGPDGGADLGSGMVVADMPPGVGRDVVDNLVAAVTAVPEPRAWALMLIGFGAAGATLRGRRRHLKYS